MNTRIELLQSVQEALGSVKEEIQSATAEGIFSHIGQCVKNNGQDME